MGKLGKLLQQQADFIPKQEQEDEQPTVEQLPVEYDNNLPEVAQLDNPFKIPEEDMSILDLCETVGPEYAKATFQGARRAMAGQSTPATVELDSKMALLLAHKLVPARRYTDTPPDKAPAEVKQNKRALERLLSRLAEDGEISE